MFTFRKNKLIKAQIDSYLSLVETVAEQFHSAATRHVTCGCDDEFRKLMDEVISKESEADDLRRKIEERLFRKSLLPEIREEVLTMIDKLDELPDKAEDIVKMVYDQSVVIPQELAPDMVTLLDLGRESIDLLIRLTRDALSTTKEVAVLNRKIDRKESEGDKIERKVIHQLFHNGEPTVRTLQLRDYVNEVGSVLDLVQDLADAMTLIAIKRVV